MIKRIDITNPEKAFDVLMVQLLSYQAEAWLINYDWLPPLQDTLETLMACGETFYGCYMRGVLCGAISYKSDNRTIDIHRLMVHPDYFRKGIAQQLLCYLEQQMRDVDRLIVSTASENKPAVNFYIKNSFKKIDNKVTTDGLSLVHFSKSVYN